MIELDDRCDYFYVDYALVIDAGSDIEKALQPAQPASLSPALIVDYLTVESCLQKPVRGPYNILYLTMNQRPIMLHLI